MRKLLIFALLSFCVIPSAWSADSRDCSRYLAPSADSLTARLVGYVSDLLDHQVIGDAELLRLEESLKQGRVENPISEESARTQTALLIHREGLQELIDESNNEAFDLAFLLKWAEQKLIERGQVREQRETVREETKILHQKIQFATIQPGTFMMGYKKGIAPGVKTEIKESFGIQVTHVTQYQWVRVMGENSSAFKNDEHTIKIIVNGKDIELQPDNPALGDPEKFIQKLNQLAANKDSLIKELIPDHQEGDVYGLPTNEQIEFVVRNRGRNNDAYFFGDDESKLKEYAWYNENSNGKPHPVALLKPLVVDGQKIWDIVGNLFTYARGREVWGFYNTICGGCFSSDAQQLRSAQIGIGGSGYVGSRLVRIREQVK
jgi:formylglycine-generating enzyme required for sulfatase activity